MPPDNILDHFARCASLDQEFPGTILKRWFEGSHGHSTTQELIIKADDGNTYRVTMDRVSADAVEEVLKDSHPS